MFVMTGTVKLEVANRMLQYALPANKVSFFRAMELAGAAM